MLCLGGEIMMRGTRKALLISAAILSGLGGEFSTFASQGVKKDLQSIDLGKVDLVHTRDEKSFFAYLDSFKDGKNDSLIEGAKNAYKAEHRPHGVKMRSAVAYLKTAQVTVSQVSQAHQEALQKVQEQLTTSEQQRHHAEQKAAEAEQRAKEAEAKAGAAAGAFAAKMGAVIQELSSIRYLAYQSPDAYEKTLTSTINASQDIKNLIVDFQKDVKTGRLIQYIRLPTTSPKELQLRTDALLDNFGKAHKYLDQILTETLRRLHLMNNPLMNEKKTAFEGKHNEIIKILSGIKDAGDIVKFLQNKRLMEDLAIEIEKLLGSSRNSMGTLYGEMNGKNRDSTYELCSHLYELHDFLVSGGKTKNFKERGEYFAGYAGSASFKPIPKPFPNISALDKWRNEYVDAQISDVLTNLFGRKNEITLTELKRQVATASNADADIAKLLKAAEHTYSVNYRKIIAEESKSFVPRIYAAMWPKFNAGGRSDEAVGKITAELKNWSKKLEGSQTELVGFMKNLENLKEREIFNFSKEDLSAVLAYLEKSYKDSLDSLKNTKDYGNKIIELSQRIDAKPSGYMYIKSLTQKIEDALVKHAQLESALHRLKSVATDALITAELGVAETIPNLHTVKGFIKDSVLRQNYLTLSPAGRAASFSYALGALGLDVPGVWKTHGVPADIHKAFLQAYVAYKEARDAVTAITGESIDDTRTFMVISDFMGGGALGHPASGSGSAPVGAPPPPPPPPGAGAPPPPPPPPLPGKGGGLVAPPPRSHAPGGSSGLLGKKPAKATDVTDKKYQADQDAAIQGLMAQIDKKIDALLAAKGRTLKSAQRKGVDTVLYQFLWDRLYTGVQEGYRYLDGDLMTCQEAINFIEATLNSPAFETELDKKLL